MVSLGLVLLLTFGIPRGIAAAQPAAQIPPAPATAKPVPQELPAVVARVNGESIEGPDLESAVQAVSARAGQAVSLERRDDVYRGVLDDLIGYTLLAQEAKARGVKVTEAEVQTHIEMLRKRFGSEEEFQKALKEGGLTIQKVQDDARTGLAVTKMLEAEMDPKITVPAEDVARFYRENQDRFREEERVRASHILISVPEKADEAAKKKARDKAQDLLAQLKKGADFAVLAKASSEDPGSASNGGDLGFFEKGTMVPEFADAAFALAPAALSDVVESPHGFHIIRVAEHRPASVVPLKDVSDQIQHFLAQQRQQDGTNELIKQLRAKGKIEVLI